MNVVVAGSLNMDVVIPLTRYPQPGETVLGGEVQYITGGKGANQAVAAARLGANVTHLGMVGQDTHGTALKEALQKDGVDVSHIQTWNGPTGMAFIHLERDGANRIIVSPGANGAYLPDVVRPLEEVIQRADAVMLQLEVPIQTVQYIVQVASRANVPVFLDPAPAREDLFDYIRDVDWLTPNAAEAERLTGLPVNDIDSARSAAIKLQQRGAKNVIVKLGEAGACALDKHGFHVQPGFSVEAVDTTAAGDAFGAGFVVEYLKHRDVDKALQYGCATGALSATKVGAQTSLPYQKDVQVFLEKA